MNADCTREGLLSPDFTCTCDEPFFIGNGFNCSGIANYSMTVCALLTIYILDTSDGQVANLVDNPLFVGLLIGILAVIVAFFGCGSICGYLYIMKIFLLKKKMQLDISRPGQDYQLYNKHYQEHENV